MHNFIVYREVTLVAKMNRKKGGPRQCGKARGNEAKRNERVKVGDLKVRLAWVVFGGEYLVYKGRLP
jgi:hypothetical protein